jgi:hypothetical protein
MVPRTRGYTQSCVDSSDFYYIDSSRSIDIDG